ncbi:hypothetical protein PIB30_034352 [Stylosanthes scabra]|uniref:TIR domain-containing protein n=1 Tax=Stylosanthes scabra TaxID=79078 RepID=A0ABU6VB15_9FABA|nr:hypothetical protein [Stylosanthes scabra]
MEMMRTEATFENKCSRGSTGNVLRFVRASIELVYVNFEARIVAKCLERNGPRSMVKALLRYLDSDSDNIQDEALGEEGRQLSQEDSASFHPLDSNMSQDSSLSQQEDSAWDHPPPESTSIITEGSSSSPGGYKYDVYLSFRGADTRRSFIDYLNHRFLEEGISAFRDQVDLEIGEIISFQILRAINDSRISIVVFSRGYASSASCLDELVALVDCHKDGKVLFPIFYDVSPAEVRNQSGAYKDAFDSHMERFKENPDKIYKWKAAMTCLANLSGFNLTDKAKGEEIESIVQEVSGKLGYKFQRTRSIEKNPESIGRRLSLQEVNKYDVFLSFRCTQTSCTFIYYLRHYLTKKGFSTFMSFEEIQRGESFPSQVLQAIKDSRVLIVVFTRDYADSTSSLEEVATIVDCHRELKQTIIPVFLDVDRRDVQTQTGPYQKAFVSYTEEFEHDPLKVQRWRVALQHMTTLHGVRLEHESEIQAIGKIIQIVEGLCSKSSRLSSHNQVGIQSSSNKLEKLLKLKDDCVRVLGIWGMAGSGKTTRALALYDTIFQQFEAACFIMEVSQVYRVGGATAVQKQILRQTLNEELSDVYSPFEISGLVRKRLSWKQLLIVFDNVDELMHLKELAINPIMLGMGSRIIITTRNRQILDAYGVDVMYQIPLLNKDEARELFLSACCGISDRGCIELIPIVLEWAHGLPLAIEVLASVLQNADVTSWQCTLNRLREQHQQHQQSLIPLSGLSYRLRRKLVFEIMEPLQTSFESLDQEEREIFLHIACFFHGKKQDYVNEVLSCCGFFAEIGIQALLDKSLITIQNDQIHVHGLLQHLGKKIVQEEDPKDPGLRSRLWLFEDFSISLNSAMEGNKLKAIVLYEGTSSSKHEYLNIEGLSKMRNLELLILYDKHFSGILPSLPHRLRYLLWDGYPFISLPSFEPYNRLVQLNLPDSRIKHLWNGCKNFPSLERVNLSYSKELKETPDFGGSPRLKRLDFTGCTNLVQIHPSVGLLKELAYLSFRNCYRLSILDLDAGCNYETKPDFTGLGLTNLEHLDLGDCTSLSTVHYSIGNLNKLKFLNLHGCKNLVEKPDFSMFPRDGPEIAANPFSYRPLFNSFDRLVELNLPYSRKERLWDGKNFPSLQRVDLSYSKKLKETPDFGGSPRLKRLDLTGCTNLLRVHPSIGLLKELAYLSFGNCCRLVILDFGHECKLISLRVLDLYSCTNLMKTPDFTGLPNLEHLDLGGCTSLSIVHHSIGTLVKLKFLNVHGCINLPKLPDIINVAALHTSEVPVTNKKYDSLKIDYL